MSTHALEAKKPIDLKVVLVGSVGVGKTSTVLRFIKDSFKQYLETTIGASYMCKTITIKKYNRSIKFSVWDTAGQEQYHSLVPLYFRKAACVIVVYDITRQQTFEDAKAWVEELGSQAPENVIIALTGNKIDLENLREVETQTGERYAKHIDALFLETSAKTSDSITELFEEIGQRFLDRLEEERRRREQQQTNDTTFSEAGRQGSTMLSSTQFNENNANNDGEGRKGCCK